MKLEDINSIELDRSVAFNHVINIKDKDDWIIEKIPVKENNGYEVLMLIVKKWTEHPSYKGK